MTDSKPQVRIDPGLYAAAKVKALKQRRPVQNYINYLLAKALEAEK